MAPISGSANITLDNVNVVPPGPPHTYFGVARNIMEGIRVLARSASNCAIPITFLGAQALECLLKAYLSRAGSDTKLKKPELRHNLSGLWMCSIADGLDLNSSLPQWVSRLNEIHDRPYYLRYSTGVNGIVTPNKVEMVDGLESVLTEVASAIGA